MTIIKKNARKMEIIFFINKFRIYVQIFFWGPLGDQLQTYYTARPNESELLRVAYRHFECLIKKNAFLTFDILS